MQIILLRFSKQVLIVGLGSLAAATPYLALILFGIVAVWLQAANSLSGQFEEAMASDEAENTKDKSTT